MVNISSLGSQLYAGTVQYFKGDNLTQTIYRVAVAALVISAALNEFSHAAVLAGAIVLSPTVAFGYSLVFIGVVASNVLAKGLVTGSFTFIAVGASSLLGLYSLKLISEKIEPYSVEAYVTGIVAKMKPSAPAPEPVQDLPV